ncbi:MULTISPECIES: HD domain-containing phosphohydrolase [unclassified Mesotoga]|jgi:CHASE1-domain containing sensor protein|uniref:HD domain-containing phosphohydrolase n=1 Tax=unclassified Mesotoga TaxID=1184398 RepID=UPI0025ED3C15|nr:MULTISPECIES: HD domain-containing phosphohydrolase [unclassified Mesotoga]
MRGPSFGLSKRLVGFAAKLSGLAVVVISVVLILLMGVLLSFAEIARGRREFSDMLLRQARFVHSGLNLDELSRLSGSIDDLDRPEYWRLKSQLEQVSALFPQYRFIYLMGQKESGELFFFIDSEPPGLGDESLPGDIYADATEYDFEVFREKKARVLPVITDSWGTWVSVMVPVIDENSGRLLAVLGIDVEANDFRKGILSYAIKPVVFSLVLILMAILSGFFIIRKDKLPQEKKEKRVQRYLEAIAFAAFGVAVTIMVSSLVHDRQEAARNDAFADLAATHVTSLSRAMKNIEDFQVEALARFFESSSFVYRQEFLNYVGSLSKNNELISWFWIERVSPGEIESFEESIRSEGFPDFFVWEPGESGAKERVLDRESYYPIQYIEPLESNRNLLGLDLGSLELVGEAIEKAAASKLMWASDPVVVPTDEEKGLHFFVFRPIVEERPQGQTGFVGAIFHSQAFHSAVPILPSNGDPTVILGLYQIDSDGNPVLLFSSAQESGLHVHESAEASIWHYPENEQNIALPVMLFGRLFVIVAHPGPDFSVVYPMNYWIFILAIGLTVTLSLAVLIGSLGNRSFHLEREVGKRTEELRESLETVSKTMEASVNVLASVVDLRDPYTSGHQRRVAELSVAIGKKLGFEENRLTGLRLSAMIHDVGKIQVPAEILNTPRKLTNLEFDLIKLHPTAGCELFKDIEFPWPVADAILQHHERLDGSGYPEGISGDQIILEARIIAVADVVEAMASHRPYRSSLGLQAALDEIRSGKGKLYDARVVDACLELFDEGFNFTE